MSKQQALFIAYLRMRCDFSYGRISQAFKQRYIAKQPFNLERLDDYTSGSNFGRHLCLDSSNTLNYNIDKITLEDLL